MKTLFLTSNLDTYYKDENGNRIAKPISNTNQMLDNLKSSIGKYDHALYIASDPTDYEKTDQYSSLIFDSLNMCIPFKKYSVLDGRNKHDAKNLVKSADFIILGGGNAPTQSKFFDEINLGELLRGLDNVILGISAGSVNCASTVYCTPELEEEGRDPNFQKYYNGLGLTEINVMPHYEVLRDEVVAGKSTWNEHIIPDSQDITIFAIPDGSYIMLTKESAKLFGEGHIVSDGKVHDIAKDGDVTEL